MWRRNRRVSWISRALGEGARPCLQLPDGAPVNRARHAVCAGDARGLGSAPQRDHRAVQSVPRHRSAERGVDCRPEATRVLEDTGGLGGEFGRTPFIQGDIRNRKQWGVTIIRTPSPHGWPVAE